MNTEPELRPLGVDGILVRFSRFLTDEANAQALAFRDRLASAGITGVTEVASSLTSVRVGFDPSKTTRDTVGKAIQSLATERALQDTSPKRLWHIPACFGPEHAPQLAEAAALAGLSVDQAIAEITAQETRVIAIGFAPGQAYQGMLPDHWDIPRQSALTESLPRGALITAVRQLIIWAADAPTGWRHIGQTAFRVYQPDTPTPFAFEPGDRVRFHAVPDSAFADIRADSTTNGGARCEVLR
ncbi:carboxyltransferase domain-containing protein [Cognatiyoonia sp. IB215446]|uniref:5-oxoprolinase subunit B family protein n=1 Tax=Cognatiyoonia sp. IB215446 TaxID=3097355 RepID=UPI002A11E464|nr:carboxyltransferase domain-containing protein [Cognatiyoonia sp. IB215446]MDX8350591.1 carboxyltransferase domain-containing protein [Cognatiyoonia sp. IB215446]